MRYGSVHTDLILLCRTDPLPKIIRIIYERQRSRIMSECFGCGIVVRMHTRSLVPKPKSTVIGLGARLVHT